MGVILSNGLFLSEIFADNVGSGGFDTDGDGAIAKSDEYVEIQYVDKTGAGSVSLDGIELWSARTGRLYQFGSSDNITGDGNTAVVVGQWDGTPDPGYYDAGFADNGKDNGNNGMLFDGEGNKRDTLYLVDTNTGEYVAVEYGLPPQTVSLPAGFPGTTLVGSESVSTGFPNGVPIARNASGGFWEEKVPPPPRRARAGRCRCVSCAARAF